MSLPGVDVAITHKILHHKRPDFFPLIDNQTLKILGSRAWLTIHDNLTANPTGWDQLERQIATLAHNRGVALTRLRLHDILLWTSVTGRDAIAQPLGRDLSPAEH